MRQTEKILLTILSTLIVCSGVLLATASLDADKDRYETILLEYNFPVPTIDPVKIDNEVYDRITMGNLPNSCDVDSACLPIKPLEILLPYGRILKTIEVDVENSISIGSGFNVEKGQSIIPIMTQQTLDYDVANQVDVSEQSLYTIVGTYTWRGYSILCVNLHPVHYLKESGEIIWFNHMNVQVKTQPSMITKSIRAIPQDQILVKKQIENPQTMTTYMVAPLFTPMDYVQYVLITNEDLRDATGTYTFQDLIVAKQNEGMTAAIFTVEDIASDAEYWVNGPWGDNNPSNPFYTGPIQGSPTKFNDTSAKIRNFIRYAYSELGTEYVLLGGDADTITSGDNIVPVRELFAVEEGLPLGLLDRIDEDIPSDVYYACLDGNFNIDGDNHWGENATQNGYNDDDEADLFCEVYVGRACADADDEVSNFVMKTLSYAASTDPYIFTGLMVGEYLGFPGVSAYGGNYKDLIIPLFPEDYAVDTLYDRDGTWSKYTLMSILNTDTPHLINHLGHGNVQYGLKMGVSDIASLTNDNYFFIYSQTCLAGSFDNSGSNDCAAEYFTVETPHGAFAVIMNARYGLGSENTLVSPSQSLDESFFTAVFTENLHALGQANHYSKEDHIWHINENGIRWVYYETNLFGDPALRIKPFNSPPETPEAPDGPSMGSIDNEYTFTAETTDPEGEDISYKFDWGEGNYSDWIGPVASGTIGSASYIYTKPGDYTIHVKAKDVNGGESGWSDGHDISIADAPAPLVEWIKGGLFYITASVKNTGGVAATNVNYTISFDGGAFIGKETTGTIATLDPDMAETIKSKFILGFGATTISVIAGSSTKTADGKVFLFLIKLL